MNYREALVKKKYVLKRKTCAECLKKLVYENINLGKTEIYRNINEWEWTWAWNLISPLK